ncbi:MAG: dihydropteroate synthase [Sphingomonadales bacterium]|nr:dihydropteroate synthase [Sphingomonadales bacterium]
MSKNTLFPNKSSLQFRGKLLFIDRPLVMGILNVTPDSFYPDSRVGFSAVSEGCSKEASIAEATRNDVVESRSYVPVGRSGTVLAVVDRARRMMEEGVDILDIGGCSTRPGAAAVPEQEELERVIPSVRAIKGAFPELLVSVDTWRASVAEQAVGEGADLINDVSGGRIDPKLIETVIRLRVPYVLMHSRGTPENMAGLTQYEDVVTEVVRELSERAQILLDAGCSDLIIDPGFGFAKTPVQGFRLLNHLDALVRMGFPVLAGVSRKSMITRTLSVQVDSSDALWGTLVLNTLALDRGAQILRVHDVAPAVQAVRLWQKVRDNEFISNPERSAASTNSIK